MNSTKRILFEFSSCLRVFVFILSLITSVSVYSQDSLRYYMQMAAQNNPTILQKYTEYQAALQKIPQVGSLPDPQLNMGVFLSPMELISGKQVATIQLMQMFPWFGVLQNAKDEMSLMANAKFELFRDAKLQVQFEVQRTYYELNKVQQNIRISEKNDEILHTLERLSLAKYKSAANSATSSSSSKNVSSVPSQPTTSGSSGSNMGGSQAMSATQPSPPMQSSGMGSTTGSSGLVDLYRIQIEIGELENNIALLKNQQTTNTTLFNTLINRAVTTPVLIPDTLKTDSLNITLTALPDSMLANSPMLNMLHYEQQSFDARKKMVTRMGYPMVGLGVNYSLINKSAMSTSEMNGKDMIMPMITITLPIYRKKYKAMQTEADLMKIASEQNSQATLNTLQTEYYEAIQLYHDAERRMKLYENQSLLSNKSLEIMIKSFSVSRSELNEILRIQQQTLDYELKQTDAVADFNTAIARLKRLGCFSN